jgi:hypothetical protein
MEILILFVWYFLCLTSLRSQWRFMLPGAIGATVFLFIAQYLESSGVSFPGMKLLIVLVALFYWGTRGKQYLEKIFPERNQRD